MDKRRLHHAWTRLRSVRPWYLLALALVSAVICVFALRANNHKMGELRDAVFAADKNNGDVETALRNLRAQVYGHMNTSLTSGQNAVHPPIQLQYTYGRLVDAQKAAIGNANDSDDVYGQAQKYCEKAIPSGFSGSNRLSCIEAYVKQHGLAAAQTIPKGLYQFDFISPTWSPDLAGWSLVTTIFLLLAAGVVALFRHVLRFWLHRKQI